MVTPRRALADQPERQVGRGSLTAAREAVDLHREVAAAEPEYFSDASARSAAVLALVQFLDATEF